MVFLVLILVTTSLTMALLYGFAIGRGSNAHRFFDVRMEALTAQRQIREETKRAFEAMVDHVQRLRGDHPIDKP